jgi:ribonucleoside-triphosphate reductase
MMIKILKKNGDLQNFNGEKIKRAVRKSAERVCITLTQAEEKKVVDTVRRQLQYNEVPVPVSTVHNMVECALDNINPTVAKSYREYRDNKSAFASMLDRVYNKKLSLNFIGDRSNANADSALVTTQKAITYNELNSELYKKFFLNRNEEKAMSDGYIYIHDRGSRLDSMNCCLFDMPNVLKGGFRMGNLDYSEPKTLDVAFDLIADISMNAAACQYGGFSLSEIDKLLAPYAEKSYNLYESEYQEDAKDLLETLHISFIEKLMQPLITKLADKKAMKKVKRDMEQGFQGWEMKFNSVASSRGDYPFTSISFGLGTSKFETMASSVCMKVRKNGQGKDGFKHPVLFPKLSFFYDENLHGKGKELEWLFDEAIDCSSKAMYPDYISCTGDGYGPSMYKKYGKTISRMGCRANLSPWYERGGMFPADENDKPVYEGRFNLGAISLHFPMIVAKAKQENRDFYEVLTYYLDMCRDIHKRTFSYLSHKKAGTNPLGFCEGGFYNGNFDPEDEIGEDFLRPMTMSFGITALNEASVLQTGKSIVEDNTFAIEVLKFINEYADKYKVEDNILYAIYGTPAESLCGLQIEQFKKKYGIIKGVSDRPYTTNSFHCGVWEDITPIQKQDIEYPMFHLCNGGNIQYCRYKLGYNVNAIKTLVRRAMDMGFYEGVNLQLDYCEECGHQFIDSDTCPKCGSGDITRIERMNGYLGYSRVNGRTMYADHKLEEFKDRVSM